MKIKHAGGRPRGRKKIAKIEVSIEPDIKHKFMTYLKEEGKQASVEIGIWIRHYIKQKESNKNL